MLNSTYRKVFEGSEKKKLVVAANDQKEGGGFEKQNHPHIKLGCEILFFSAREFQFDDVMIGSIMASFLMQFFTLD